MAAGADAATTSTRGLWTGRVLSALVVLFLLFDAIIHLVRPATVVAAFGRLGWDPGLSRPIGVLELGCLVIYTVPRLSGWGAILLTGYLGGAVATQLRAGSPFVGETLFPVYVGVVLWGGLLLRNRPLRGVLLVRGAEDRAA